jgi:rhamnosyltransferase
VRIAVLLSTYNGAAYLPAQLDSVLAQQGADLTVFVRDDGSSDGTQDILRAYAAADGRVRYVNPDESTNIGVVLSFFSLLRAAHGFDAYGFCDQDDVWQPEKLAVTARRLSEVRATTPALVYTDLAVVDENLAVMNPSMIRSQSGQANTQFVQELTENSVTGSTALFNAALRERLLSYTGGLAAAARCAVMHDWWAALVAAAFGELIYMDRPTVLYRQHGQNVLGARTWKKRLKKLAGGHFFERYWDLIKRTQLQAIGLLEGYGEALDVEKRDLLAAFAHISAKPFGERVRDVRTYNLRKNRAAHTAIFRFLLRTNFLK